MSFYRAWLSFGIAMLASSVVALTDCSGGGSVVPGTSGQKTVSDANAFMRSITPASARPDTIAIAPMQGLDGTRPAMSLRNSQSTINALNFTQLQGAAVYVAASPDGTFWVLSTQGLPSGDKFIYHFTGGTFVNVPGAAVRIAVGPDKTPWVVNAGGGIYHLVNGAFAGIAGGASELSVGGTPTAPFVDVISNQTPGPFGAGIYQYSVNSASWSQLPGAGTTVAASIDNGNYPALNINAGGFYVTNRVGGIFYNNPTTGFEQLPGGAIRLAPTASGGLFALGDPANPVQHGIYYNDLSTGTWTQMPGAAVSISANPQGLIAIGAAGGIYQSPITASTPSPSPTASGFYYDFTGYTVHVPAGLSSMTTSITAPLFASGHYGQVVIWPGVEPAGGTYVLQPILEFTNTAALPNPTSSLIDDNLACCGSVYFDGGTRTVHPGDVLNMSTTLSGTTWTIATTDVTTGVVAPSISYNAGSTLQTDAYFVIETHYNSVDTPFNNYFPSAVFGTTQIVSKGVIPTCALTTYSANPTTHTDVVSNPVSSGGGTTCTYATMTLYPELAASPSSVFFPTLTRRTVGPILAGNSGI